MHRQKASQFGLITPCRSSKSWHQLVIILGDAAHAIPPTAGQGASQAFEDAYTLAVLLSKLSTKTLLPEALNFWQITRQVRIDKVIALTFQLNNTRLPQAERERLSKGQVWQSGEDGQLAWLYNARVEEDFLSWAEKNEQDHSVDVAKTGWPASAR